MKASDDLVRRWGKINNREVERVFGVWRYLLTLYYYDELRPGV